MAASVQHVKKPGVGVGVYVTSKSHPNCVILGRRKGSTGSGLYALPGGHLEFGEEWVECALRETEEETGLRLKNVVYSTVVNAVVREDDYHYITIFMRGEVDEEIRAEPVNTEPHKCEGWEWINWDEFPPGEELFCPLRIARQQGNNPFKELSGLC